MRSSYDITDQRFGRLVALERAGRTPDGKSLWRVRCDCGTVKAVRLQLLLRGHTRSCGCLQRERAAAAASRRRKHGHAVGGRISPEYQAWQQMRTRCYNSNHVAWEHYGGRGIQVCRRWRESFPAFLEDVGPRPSDGHSLDRIDVNGDYEPSNVRWATAKQQAANRRPQKKRTDRPAGGFLWRNRWRTHEPGGE